MQKPFVGAGSPRHAALVEPSAILSVASLWVFFSQSSAWFLKWLKFEGTPARTSANGLGDWLLPAARCSHGHGSPRV